MNNKRSIDDGWTKAIVIAAMITAGIVAFVMVVGTAFAPKSEAYSTPTVSAKVDCSGKVDVTAKGDDEHEGILAGDLFAGPIGVDEVITKSTRALSGEFTWTRSDANHKVIDLAWSVVLPTNCTPPPPNWNKTKYKLRVVDRCKCKHDTVRVVGKHLKKVKIHKDRNKWTITVKAKPGFKVPAEPGSKVFVKKTTFKVKTTNKPCRCKATHSCKPDHPQTCRPSVNARGRGQVC